MLALNTLRFIHFLNLYFLGSILFFISAPPCTYAEDDLTNLVDLSIEELLTIKVTSVMKKLQAIKNIPAAVSIITQEDIKRSGCTSIPELLRMVPGFHVARISSNEWAITCRGFNDVFANKLLILMDGRSLYSNITSGVEWHLHDTMLADIERIEIIRGPGGTLWGSNAVNGIVNIVTKSSHDTVGLLADAGGGNLDSALASVRYGFATDNGWAGRLYGKYTQRDKLHDQFGNDSADKWWTNQTGFRVDKEFGERNSITFQGDVYTGEASGFISIFTLESEVKNDVEARREDFFGGNLLAKWVHTFSVTSDMALQIYYDHRQRDKDLSGRSSAFFESIPFSSSLTHIYDVDFQHRFAFGMDQEVVWGMGCKWSDDNITFDDRLHTYVDPEKRRTLVYSGFLQDEIILLDGQLTLTLGSKFEHNQYTGWEYQPNGRLFSQISEYESIWFAVSRAVRTPARFEIDYRQFIVQVMYDEVNDYYSVLSANGSSDYESETLQAYELGYRFNFKKSFLLDIAGFYNQYDDLQTWELINLELYIGSDSEILPYAISITEADNKMEGTTYGVECAVEVSFVDYWRLKGNFTYFEADLRLKDGSRDYWSLNRVNQDPKFQFSVWSFFDLPKNFELDFGLRYIDEIPVWSIDSYTELGVRVGYQPIKNIELEINGQNLLHKNHVEYINILQKDRLSVMERSIMGKIIWRY